MSAKYTEECDECGREDVVGCIGGTHYYCARHEDKVAAMHAADLEQSEQTYKIVRHRFNPALGAPNPPEVIDRGLTLAEVQAHCQREDTHGNGWFDGYEAE